MNTIKERIVVFFVHLFVVALLGSGQAVAQERLSAEETLLQLKILESQHALIDSYRQLNAALIELVSQEGKGKIPQRIITLQNKTAEKEKRLERAVNKSHSVAGKKRRQEYFIFQLQEQSLTTSKVRSLVKKIDRNSTGRIRNSIDGKSFYYADEKTNTYFFQDVETGNFSFNRGMEKYLGDFRPNLPPADKVDRLARKYLQKNRLLPRRTNELKLVHLGGLRADSGVDGEVIDKMRTITYGRSLKGVPVVGSGSKIVVHVGDRGEITGLVRKWREVSRNKSRRVRSSELISEKAARNQFQKQISAEFGKNATALIESIKLVYYDGDGNYIQPAFSVISTVMVQLSKDVVNKIPHMMILPALKRPPEAIDLLRIDPEAKRLLKKSDIRKGSPDNEGGSD